MYLFIFIFFGGGALQFLFIHYRARRKSMWTMCTSQRRLTLTQQRGTVRGDEKWRERKVLPLKWSCCWRVGLPIKQNEEQSIWDRGWRMDSVRDESRGLATGAAFTHAVGRHTQTLGWVQVSWFSAVEDKKKKKKDRLSALVFGDVSLSVPPFSVLSLPSCWHLISLLLFSFAPNIHHAQWVLLPL